MFRIVCRIIVNQQGNGRNEKITFTKVSSVLIERSFDKQTQTAKVVLPRNVIYNNKNIYEGNDALLRRGDKITIIGAYHPNETVLFEGYISKINNNVPVELLCEDEMFILKQAISPNLSFKSVTLKTLLSKMLTETKTNFKAIDAQLGQIRLQGASIGKVLQVLRDQYGLYSYFVNNTLYVGLAFYPDMAQEAVFLFEKMIADGMNLTYLKKDDVKVKINGIIIKENSREEYTYGDASGDIRTVFQYGGTKAELDVKCKSFLEQANYTGYFGTFRTFLEPPMVPGDYVVVDSWKFPERKGKYLIKSVATEISTSAGGKQTIELERRIL